MYKSGIFRRIIGIFFLASLFAFTGASAQDTKDENARSPHPARAKGKAKEAEKKKIQQKKLAEKAIEKGRKRHEKLQTRDVRKRMKKSKHTATANNAHKREFFLKRWFQKKHKTKRR